MNNDPEQITRTERLLQSIIARFDRPSKLVLVSIMISVPLTWAIVYVANVPFEWLIGAPLIALLGSFISTYVASKILFTYQARIQKQNEILKEQAAALQVANAELDAFASTVAHDLKTPLSTIAGYANLLYSDWSSLKPVEIKQILAMMDKSAHNMSNIVDEILFFARSRHAENLDLSPLNMREIVMQALERLNEDVQRRAAEIILPDSWPTAVGYAPWVEEIWTNYLSNGLKYGGQPPRLELGAAVDQDHIRFWVTDNGKGLSKEDQQYLFDEFTRLDSSQNIEGTGLGLSIVRRISKKLGGDAGVESGLGEGCTFYFTLPSVTKPSDSLTT